MYDINLKNVKKGKGIYYVFLIVGILFLLIFGGVFALNIFKANSLDSSVMSTSVEVNSYFDDEGDEMYRTTYYYEVEGEKYTCSSSVSTSIFPGEQNKKVYYDSKNPSNCITQDSKSFDFFMLIFLIVPIIFIIIAIKGIKDVNKRVKAIKDLNQKGKLIKNLPYRLEDSNISVNNVPLQKPVIDYTLPNGITISLYGDTRHDKKYYDSDGKVDLIIDENNPENYYIDFEINRLSGNLPNDYYYEKRSEISYCVNCGNQVDPNFKFCKKCGKEQ